MSTTQVPVNASNTTAAAGGPPGGPYGPPAGYGPPPISPLVMPGVPIGASISIVIIALLLFSLIKSFNGRKIATNMKVSSIAVFVVFMLNVVFIILGQVVIARDQCMVRVPISLGAFMVSRAVLFYFFIVRVEASFIGSSLEMKPSLIKGAKIITVIMYSLFFLSHCLFSPFNEYSMGRCMIKTELLVPYSAVTVVYTITDLGLGVFTIGIYLWRLYSLYKEMKVMDAMDNTHNTNDKLLVTIKKQGKLAWAAYISTLLIVRLGPPLGMYMFTYVDAVVNVFCVYCTFDFPLNAKCYKYLCNCAGKIYLQIPFCYICCCCCCNERPRGTIDARKEVNDATASKKSQASTVEVTGTGTDPASSAQSADTTATI